MTSTNSSELDPQQLALLDVWQNHVTAEFVHRDLEAALSTLTEDACVNHVPLLMGGEGKRALRSFYGDCFLPQLPPDIESTLISRTIGQDRIVEESVFRFTHSLRMDWFLPGVTPTGKRIEVAVAGIVQFRDGQICHERLYWDQASVLVQIGLLNEHSLPVAGAQVARRLLDSSVPMNELLRRAS